MTNDIENDIREIRGPREISTDALRDRHGHVSSRLGRLLGQAKLSPSDRGLARELTMGVVRTRGVLDSVIKAYLNQPDKKLPMPVRNILQVALYQILYLDRIPTFAAVDQAVQQTKKFHKRQSPMVNGLLRSVDRDVVKLDTNQTPSLMETDVVYISHNKGCKFPKPIFPDPQSQPVEYLAAAWSLSPYLAQKWTDRFDSPKQLIKIARHTCCTPPLILRVNNLKTTVEEALSGFDAAGITASVHNNGKSIVLDSGDALSAVLASGLFTDADNDPLILTATLANGDPLPSWLNFDANTATFSGTPLEADEGALSVRVISTDPSGASASIDFAIQINSVVPGVPVTDNPFADQSAAEDVAFAVMVPVNTFSDPDGDTLTLSATLLNGDPLPTWLDFDAATAIFSGTPDQVDAGVISIAITATDPGGLNTTDVFTLTVDAVNEAPVLAVPIVDQNATEETAYSLVLAEGVFTDPDGDVLTYSVKLENGAVLPSWLNFDAVTRTLSGTPDDPDMGVLQLTATATDPSGLVANDNFDLTIAPINDAPVVAAEQADQSGQEGTAFSYTVPAATFADVDDATLILTATLVNGDPLPAWLNFDAVNGTFSGTPTVADIGSLNVRVTATDAGNLFVSDDFVMEVTTASTDETLYNDIAGTTQFLFGTTEGTDVFVVDGNVADYSWNNTEDGLGIVIWNASGPDLLYDFDEIRFNDMSVSLNATTNEYHDLPGVVQFLNGASENDTFVVAGVRADYNIGATEDGTGVVIWTNGGHDLLYDFENIQFDDETVILADETF